MARGAGTGTSANTPLQPTSGATIVGWFEAIVGLDELDPLSLEPIYEQEELDEPLRVRLRMEFATTGTEVHQVDIGVGPPPLAQDLLASIARKTNREGQTDG